MESYDYVIVGAGTAGCVLAARLSEDLDVTVCLIEAGPVDDSDNIRIPAAGGKLLRSQYDWDYNSNEEPQLGGRRLYLPRGRVLGGTSALNGMVHIRGNARDFDEWCQPGWTYETMLPYFVGCEDNERGASAHHGTGGPLPVAESRSRNPMAAAFVRAAVEAGFPANDDFNGPSQDGFGFYQVNQRNGRRCSAAAAYLHPSAARPNLTVRTRTHAHRVLVEGGRACGVRVQRYDEVVDIRAQREVIVAAGAYNSPQLLMLSGIGPAERLAAAGVPVLADLPEVGRNLQDHPAIYLVFTHDEPVSLLSAGEESNVRQFEADGSGPLSSNVPEAGGFVRTQSDLAAPDVQYHVLPVMFVECALGESAEHGISFGPCVLRPASRGEVSLASDDPTAKPRIRHQYYEEPADLRTMTAGLRIAMELARQPSLAPYTVRPYAYPASTDEADLHAFVRAHTQSVFHPAGTCAIGPVLDPDLRVHGVDGLRVVDASVLPLVPRGNTNAPTVAVAERAADLIRGRTEAAHSRKSLMEVHQ
ncbi:GMC family oxidoreductase [Micromonospora sp. NBC_01813]|uniref:GMC family oxidoreductase n=1 Tax=Micromonospora sp. NBC_01813 TaxID=2975988 RepID=UPI002DDB2244|nr:GMC family oxidoreductase N-terminal domain-containing protein [Micromonospora sp. NBC_01813]WSA10250.1 GMC family oxidoreductase N-terminal domain-containing protein [Micromonospora sp. NBC_01813]